MALMKANPFSPAGWNGLFNEVKHLPFESLVNHGVIGDPVFPCDKRARNQPNGSVSSLGL